MKTNTAQQLRAMAREIKHLTHALGEAQALHERCGLLTAQRDQLAHEVAILKRWLLERERKCKAYEARIAELVCRPRVHLSMGSSVPAPILSTPNRSGRAEAATQAPLPKAPR